jgi:hypothetical protein
MRIHQVVLLAIIGAFACGGSEEADFEELGQSEEELRVLGMSVAPALERELRRIDNTQTGGMIVRKAKARGLHTIQVAPLPGAIEGCTARAASSPSRTQTTATRSSAWFTSCCMRPATTRTSFPTNASSASSATRRTPSARTGTDPRDPFMLRTGRSGTRKIEIDLVLGSPWTREIEIDLVLRSSRTRTARAARSLWARQRRRRLSAVLWPPCAIGMT